MTELERLKKEVVVKKDSLDAAFDYEDVAWYAWNEAKLELARYLKEHGDERS